MIQEGLLWFDDHPTRELYEKIDRAVARYREKYQRDPDVCYVNPSALLDGATINRNFAVKVLPAKSILPHHFWLGIEDKSKDKKVSARK